MTGQRIHVVNASTLITADEARAMTRACNRQARDHAAPAWGLLPPYVTYLEDPKEAEPGSWVLTILDDSDQAGALGWHTEEKGVIYGRVFARPSLQAGSTALTGQYAVSSVLSHEVLETLGDPSINGWCDTGRGYLIAREVCDPVEADTYEIPDHLAGQVAVSNFVLASWFDPQATGKVDYLGLAAGPLHMTKGGYWVQAGIGAEKQQFARTVAWEREVGFDIRVGETGDVVFSAEVPEWRKEAKLAAGGRGIRKASGTR